MQNDPQVATVTDLLKRSQKSLFGKYRGVVKFNDDPKSRGRLRLEIPSVFGVAMTDWVVGAFPFGGNSKESMIFIPAVGSHVLVEFIEGDISSPVWTATYYPDDASADNGGLPPESFDGTQPGLHQIRTEQGLELRLEDNRQEGDESEQRFVVQHPKGASIEIAANGTITISDQETGVVLLDPENKVMRINGHNAGSIEISDEALTLQHGDTSLVLDSSGITATATAIKLDGDSLTLGKGANAPIMNAQAFVTAFSSHVHPCPTGSTSPPAPPDPTLAQSSSLTKVKGA